MDRFSVDAEFEGACGAVEVLIDTLEDVNFERPVNHVSGKVRKGSSDAYRVAALLPCESGVKIQLFSSGPTSTAASDRLLRLR